MRTNSASVVQCLVCVTTPPPGVLFAVQKGRAELLPPFDMQPGALWFAISLRLGPPRADGAFDFRGDFVQGPSADRFVYINSGTLAGQPGSCWTRRAKLKLAGIPRSTVEAVIDRRDLAIRATVPGTSGDGGPVCASVPSTAVTWAIAEKAS